MINWYYKEENGNFAVGSIPTVEVDGVIEEDSGWVQIADRPTPYDDYVFDGIDWVAKPIPQLSISELKRIGKEYNGYQVPLDEEAQIAVTSVAVQYLAGLFTGTVFHFSNGVKMPCTNEEFLPFAQWFGTERNAFFVN